MLIWKPYITWHSKGKVDNKNHIESNTIGYMGGSYWAGGAREREEGGGERKPGGRVR
jgi:hypothetical protein